MRDARWLSLAALCAAACATAPRSEEHTSELQSQSNLVCRLLLEKINPGYATCAADAPSTAGAAFIASRARRHNRGTEHPPRPTSPARRRRAPVLDRRHRLSPPSG